MGIPSSLFWPMLAVISAFVFGCMVGEVATALFSLISRFRSQADREAALVSTVRADWRESFSGSIDEFNARDGA